MRGGEKVLEEFCELFPSADIFTLLHVRGSVSPTIERHRILTSPLQKIPGIAKSYRHLLPLMPWAIEQLDLTGYDLVISTSHCVAKGVIPRGGAPHWCYCHTPMRYVWDQYDQYFGPGRAGLLTRTVMGMVRPALQRWDLRSNARVHHFIANSENVAERIRRIYQRDAVVIYPPVDFDFYSALPLNRQPEPSEPYYLIVSALAPYKRVDLAIEAFNDSGRKLLIVGEGQENRTLRRLARSDVQFLGWLERERMREFYSRCQALIFPGEEDFGIVPLEAMAAGRPVIAYRKGGALETVIEGVTGCFFDSQTLNALNAAIAQSAQIAWDPTAIRRHAAGFSRQRCVERLRRVFIEYTG
jgi:glycosyltransferase involved in cell wall biosynthesis